MDQNPVKPPDMLGAGGSVPPYPTQDAVGLLRSQGSMPGAALGLLQQPTANPYAAAISAGMPFIGRPDVLSQQVQQARQGQQQQFQQVMQVQQMQRQDQERKWRENKDVLGVYEKFLSADNDAARAFGAQGVGATLKNMGVQAPDAALKGIAQKALSVKDFDGMVTQFARGATPQAVHALYPSVPPQVVAEAQAQGQSVLSGKGNPVLTRALLGKTPDEIRKGALDLQEKELKARGVDVSSESYGELLRLANGRSVESMTDPELQALRARADKIMADRKLATDMRKIQETEAIRHRNRMAEIDERESQRAAHKPALTPALRNQAFKLQAEQGTIPLKERRADEIQAAVKVLHDKGILPEGATFVDQTWSKLKLQQAVKDPEVGKAINTLRRFGTALVVGAERDLGMQAGTLRLKIIAEAEAGDISLIPAAWWDEFFRTYRQGLTDRKDVIQQQLDTMGVEGPLLQPPKPAQAGPLKPPAEAVYKQLRDGGKTHEQAVQEMKTRGY